ncbi:MAG: hypothetical protein H3Z51_10080 [archaeon]|nr:hypothetical protein [archaeon]
MAINISVLAYTFPAISIVLGFLLLIIGDQTGSIELRTWGGNLIIIGAGLQALYLLLRYGKKYTE